MTDEAKHQDLILGLAQLGLRGEDSGAETLRSILGSLDEGAEVRLAPSGPALEAAMVASAALVYLAFLPTSRADLVLNPVLTRNAQAWLDGLEEHFKP